MESDRLMYDWLCYLEAFARIERGQKIAEVRQAITERGMIPERAAEIVACAKVDRDRHKQLTRQKAERLIPFWEGPARPECLQ